MTNNNNNQLPNPLFIRQHHASESHVAQVATDTTGYSIRCLDLPPSSQGEGGGGGGGGLTNRLDGQQTSNWQRRRCDGTLAVTTSPHFASGQGAHHQ